ncbi:unnamed protein product [Amoebophrya sp. A25]|nr:unnamed protein product [Amoebophrya sp. A25]|eukprot:GSA25T00009103001.1
MGKGSGSDASSAKSTKSRSTKSDLTSLKAFSAVEWKEHLRATPHAVQDDARGVADRAYGTQQFDDRAINDDPRGDVRFAADAGTATGSKSVSSPKKTLETADWFGWQSGGEQDGDLTEFSDSSDDEGSLFPGGHMASRGRSYTATFFGTKRRPRCCWMPLKGAAFVVACICLILLSLALGLFFCCGEDEAPAGKGKAVISGTPRVMFSFHTVNTVLVYSRNLFIQSQCYSEEYARSYSFNPKYTSFLFFPGYVRVYHTSINSYE